MCSQQCGAEQFQFCRTQNVEAAATTAAETDRLTEPIQVLALGRHGSHDGESVEVAGVGGLRKVRMSSAEKCKRA
jgi:hypothetical protein